MKPTDRYVIDDREARVFRVNRQVFTDPECLEQEWRRIFDTCWVYVGHESEVRTLETIAHVTLPDGQ
jgi:p-cumate 2,3-dioxygenase subunit alpha